MSIEKKFTYNREAERKKAASFLRELRSSANAAERNRGASPLVGTGEGLGPTTPAMKYILNEHTDTPNVSRITICDTEEQRNKATLEAIFGTEDYEGEAGDAYLNELRENFILTFEGDPGLEWINACEVVGPNK